MTREDDLRAFPKDGGSAFPQHVLNPTRETYPIASNAGMSLRDYFAAHAMVGFMMAAPFSQNEPENSREETYSMWVSRRSFEMADAMLKAKEKNQ